MDRFKPDSWVVNAYQLYQRIPGFRVFSFFPYLFCGCKAVVSISYGIEKRSCLISPGKEIND